MSTAAPTYLVRASSNLGRGIIEHAAAYGCAEFAADPRKFIVDGVFKIDAALCDRIQREHALRDLCDTLSSLRSAYQWAVATKL